MLCCFYAAAKKKKKTNIKIHVWEDKKQLKSIVVGEPTKTSYYVSETQSN